MPVHGNSGHDRMDRIPYNLRKRGQEYWSNRAHPQDPL